jgi:hypothetical protein
VLNTLYFSRLKLEIEQLLNVNNLKTYPTKPASKDIFNLTCEFTRIKIKRSPDKQFSVFYTKYLYTKNLISLAGNITRYNVEYTQAITASPELL